MVIINFVIRAWKECQTCAGTGKVKDKACPACKGEGGVHTGNV